MKKETKPFKNMVIYTEKDFEKFKKKPVPMKKETLEEAALEYSKWRYPMLSDLEYPIRDFVTGAKWQQERSYSEEEVKRLVFDFYYDMSHKMKVSENLISENETNVDLWFKTNKKK